MGSASRKPFLHRQVRAVLLKNVLLQLRHPFRFLIMFITIPVLVSLGHSRAAGFDEPHDNPVILDPYESRIIAETYSYNGPLYWGTHPTSPSIADIGNIGPYAADNSGIFSKTDWRCGRFSREDCPPYTEVLPTTVNVNEKEHLELHLYNLYALNSSDIRYSFFIDQLSHDHLSLQAYLNASGVYEVGPGSTYIVYNRYDWIAISNFFLNGLRRSINEQNQQLPLMNLSIIPAVQAFPYSMDLDFFVGSQLVSLFLLGLLVLPLVYLPFISERKSKVLSLCKVLGMSEQSMVLGSMVTGALFCLFISCVLVIPGIFFKVRFFSKNSFLILVVLIIVHGAALASVASFLSSITPNTNIGVVVSLFMVIIFGVTASIPVFNTAGFNWKYFYYPPYPIYHSYLLLGRSSCWSCTGYTFGRLFEFSPQIIASIGNAFIFSIIALILSKIFAGAKIQLNVFNIFKYCKSEKQDIHIPLVDIENPGISNNLDGFPSDVALERRIALTKSNQNVSIAAVDVCKVYNPHSVDRVDAVKNVSMAVPKGSCRVLLGVNGSGKTTLMSMLIGQLAPTSYETISLNNVEIFENIQRARFSMGFVPQHSVFWTDLTVADHLRFFASLKLPWKEVDDAVSESLRSVGLKHAQSKKLSTLSGGQKRRASIAFALIGRPQLIVADELTTGISLDISQQIWEIIKKSKKEGVTLLVSTHFMQEATTISDSISIQKSGEILCVDSVENLQMRFGQGYRLFVSVVPQFLPKIRQFLSQIENSQHFSTVNNVLHFQLPRKIQLSQLFKHLNNFKNQNQIIDFGVQSATLEDVFLSLNN
ncbi:hypothetical protein GEMRC1_008038 [Eukaryota sp. GEM-RC1]